MTPEQWEAIKRLFHAALEYEPSQRPAFLARACAGDLYLRQEVEALLASHEQAETFIETPASDIAAALVSENRSELVAGQMVGPHRIAGVLATGGMGEVYLAEDVRLGRKIALKMLTVGLTYRGESHTRFLREARLASTLDHPNICTIHEIGEDSGRRFIAMQYIEGKTLKELIDREPLDLSGLLSIGLQVADALRAAHGVGIIHRDIKSSNIMVTPRGQAKVLDFGLAKSVEKANRMSAAGTGAELTHTGMTLGTPAYMSPEQARGEAADYRSDIFSFGAVLYEMATGRLPFKEPSQAETMNAIINKPHEPAISWNKELPVALSDVIDRALAKRPDDRYQSAEEMIEDLRSCARTIGLITSSSPDGIVVPYAMPQHRTGFMRLKRLMLRPVPIAAVTIVLAVAVVFFLIRMNHGSPPSSEIKSLVVLPLENLSGDPSQEYFADGMTDALITDLAKIGALRVIARTSAMHYKGTKKALPQIASELNVDAVVEGTVQRAGDRVSIRVQLIQAATDRHLWVETYERDLGDVLGLQSEIAQTIARAIQTKVTSAEQVRLARNRSVNRKAFDDYLQGRYYWSKRTKENLEKAKEYFQSAINADPTYAPAYVGLADCYISLGMEMVSGLPPMEARRRAEEAVAKALELDRELAEAHAGLGWAKHFNWDDTAAEREFILAIELNPNNSNAHHYYAGFLATRGRFEEAIAEVNRAQELDPFSLVISAQRGFILENARRYDEAIDQLRRVLAMDQDNYQALWFLGHTYAASGRFNEAIAASEKAAALSGRVPGALGILGLVYGLAGRTDEANKILNELLELKRRRYVSPGALANVYIGLGNKDQAFFWLEKASEDGSYYMVWLKVWPLVDPLRSDARFDDLLRRIGLAQ